jgi:hypothetical protein
MTIGALLLSCTPLLKNSAITNECDNLTIEFTNENIDNRLFLRNVKNSLDSKLALVVNKNVDATKRPPHCRILITIATLNLPSIIDNGGNVSRENRKITAKYQLETKNRKITRDVELFYGMNSSLFKYSDYVKDKKENRNLSETLAEDLFVDILESFR